MDEPLLTPNQRKIAYLITAVGNGALIPVQAMANTLPLWALVLLGAWNAGVAALALSNTPSG